MSAKPPSTGFLLTVSPDHPRFAACLDAVANARATRAEVYLYCLDDGIAALADPRLAIPTQEEASRFHLLGCASAAEKRGLPRSPDATYGGLKMLSDVIAHAGSFQSF